jgi:hypothetical protein
VDSNHRPPGPEPGALARLSHAPNWCLVLFGFAFIASMNQPHTTPPNIPPFTVCADDHLPAPSRRLIASGGCERGRYNQRSVKSRGTWFHVQRLGHGPRPDRSPFATGGLNPPGPVNLAEGLEVLIVDGSAPIFDNPALYAGSAPTLSCGVVQIDIRVPTSAPAGVYQFFPWSAMKRPAGDTVVASGSIGVTIPVK